MAYIQVRLSGDEYAALNNQAREAGVSPSTMLAFILDRGDKHRKPSRVRRQIFLRRGDNHLKGEKAESERGVPSR